MARNPITPAPGLKPRATRQATGKAWWDMSLVRWNGAEMVPIGGWAKLPSMQLSDAVRGLLMESQGYRTRISEFISDAHTHRNVMIAGVRGAPPVMN